MKKILVLIAVMFLTIESDAVEVSIDGIKYNLNETEKTACVITDYAPPPADFDGDAVFRSFYSGDIVIPETVIYDDVQYGVTAIYSQAFFHCENLTSIKIPSSITNIGLYAFSGCNSLRAVFINDIDSWLKITFSDYDSNPLYYAHHLYVNDEEILDLTIPNSVNEIRDYSFVGCSSLKSLIIPNSVTSIGNMAFDGCGLEYVSISCRFSTIGEKIFNGCSNLKEVEFDCYSIPSIFKSNTSIKKVIINEGATIISDEAFYSCSGLISTQLPSTLTTIGAFAFMGCSSIQTIDIPENVTNIGQYAFYGCNSLNNITIPTLVQQIGDNCFFGCRNLLTATFRSNSTSIGSSPFGNCNNLVDIYSYSNKILIGFENCLDYINANGQGGEGNVTLHVPANLIDSYKNLNMNFKEIVAIEEGEPIQFETCIMPTISFDDGKLTFESETDGAECHYEIKVEDAKEGVGTEVALSSAYEITVYASKEGYNDSDKNTATLYWVNVDPIPTGLIDNEMKVNTNAILVQNAGGEIVVSGLADGNDVEVYNLSGQFIAQGKASGNHVKIGTHLSCGDICIIKIGDKSVKYLLR